jgi:tetratricopeptide (TPR) repeat protein
MRKGYSLLMLLLPVAFVLVLGVILYIFLPQNLKEFKLLNSKESSAVNPFEKAIEEVRLSWAERDHNLMLEQAKIALTLASSDEEKGIANYWLGVAYYRKQMLPEAKDAEQKALELLGEDTGPLTTMSSVMTAMGDYAAALDYGRRAVKADPNYPWARNALALALFESGVPGEAIKELEEAVRLDPDNVTFKANLSKVRELTSQ